ncbi:MAG: O-antigen ligase family protein [Candidatus Omnitrophica bacterium]|jgi:O-antigen ligase|nr:O-antigen ligase family protein [Candidatus Omnitrophota bacterium]
MKNIIQKFDIMLLVILAAFVIFIPFSKQIAKIIFIAVILWVFITALKFRLEFYKYLVPKTVIAKPLLFFFLALLISTLASLDFYKSQQVFFERFMIYFAYLFLGYLFTHSKKNFNIFVISILLSSFIIGLGGLWSRIHSCGRLFYFFGLSINLSAFLLLYLPLNFFVAFFASKKTLKLIAVINILLLFSCLIWHASRAAALAILISLLVISFLKDRKLGWSLVIFLIILTFFLFPGIKDRAVTTFNPQFWGDRISLWSTAIAIFQDFPIFGAGLGLYEKLLYIYSPHTGYSESFIHLHAHNTYLEALSEIGLLGLIAFLSIFIIFFKNTFKLLKTVSNNDIQAVQLGLSAGILAMLIFAFSSTVITVGVQDTVLFWFLLGGAMGLGEII